MKLKKAERERLSPCANFWYANVPLGKLMQELQWLLISYLEAVVGLGTVHFAQ